MSRDLVWLSGRMLPRGEATVGALTPTAQYGVNVFESVRCYWREDTQKLLAFRLDDHLRRLRRSMRIMRLESNLDEKAMRAAFIEVVRANEFREDISVRQVVFLVGDAGWSALGPTDMLIAPIRKGRHLRDDAKGIQCCVASWERISDRTLSPRVKAGANYLSGRLAQIEAADSGYDMPILLNDRGKVAEAPGACVAIIRDGALITPPVTASVLESITREMLLTLARHQLGIPVVEREVDRTELYIADEVFVCGTAVEVVPVLGVDRLTIGSGEPGAITTQLTDLYFRVVRGMVDSYGHWLTEVS